jgi:hypothetical protein
MVKYRKFVAVSQKSIKVLKTETLILEMTVAMALLIFERMLMLQLLKGLGGRRFNKHYPSAHS